MKKLQYIVIFILLTAVLCGCSQEGTEYVISEFDSESKIEIEISDALDTKVNVSVKYKIFEYNDSNIAMVDVINDSASVYKISIQGTYLDESGNAIQTETKTFAQFSAGYQNYFLFNPGFAFADFTYEVKCTAYNGPEYAKDLEFKLLRVAKDKAPIYEQQVKEDYKLYPTLLAFFSSGNNGDKRVQAAITWVFFNEKDEAVFIFDRMPIIGPGQKAGNGGKCFPIYQTTEDELNLPEELQGELKAIACVKDVKEYTDER